MNNPTMREEIFERHQAMQGEAVMTMSGTLGKVGILLALLIGSAVFGWQTQSPALIMIGVFAGLGIALTLAFKPHLSPVLAPIYALAQGTAVGAISHWYSDAYAKTQYSGLVPLAVMGTLAVTGVMLALYATRIIRVTETLMMVVVGATLAVGVTYLLTIVTSFFTPAMTNMPIYGAGPIGIAFSVFVIGLAAFNLLLDFHVIETGVDRGAPKYMEWYGAFGLLVTLVWLYIEILRLLSKLARR